MAWINLQLFNFRGELINDPVTLAMWPIPRGFVGYLNPCGQTGSNPSKENAGHISLRFESVKMVYPETEVVLSAALEDLKLQSLNENEVNYHKNQ